MNWTALVYGGPMLLVTLWWFVSARKWFKGPKVNIEHMMLGQGENVLEGKAGGKEREEGSEGELDVKRVTSTDKAVEVR